MSTESIAANYFSLSESLPISRFLKWFKLEYTILAAKFVAGVAVGSVAGATSSWGHPFVRAVESNLMPRISDDLVDMAFKNEMANSANKLSPKTMNKLSIVASYTGAILGNVMTICTIGSPTKNVALFCNLTQCIFGFSYTIRRKQPRPPSGPSLAG